MNDHIYVDVHVHTHLSPCGKPQATAEAMIHRAQEKGMLTIGFADHFTPDPVPGCPFYDHQGRDILDRLRAEIEQVSLNGTIEILVGIEADYTLAGTACLDPIVLSQVDHVICAASHFHLPAAPQPARDEPRTKAELMLRMARESLVLSGVSVWAHPFDCKRMRPLAPILDTVTEQELAALIALANEHEVAIEINGGPALQETYRQAMAHFYGLAREIGARFTATADAHHPDDLERLDLAFAWAREMGFRDSDFLTTSELRERQGRKQHGSF